MRMSFRRTSSHRAGFGLVDICVALVVLSTALGMLVAAIFSGIRLARTDEETAQACQALRTALTRLGSLDPRQAFAILNDEASDDVQGQTAAQYLFVVEELLTDRQGQPVTIQVTLPVDADQPGVLREDLELPALGLPRDLDGDGEIDGSNHAADAILLPLMLHLEWVGSSGPQSVQLATILGS